MAKEWRRAKQIMERYLAPFKFFNVWRRPPKEHHQSLHTLDDMRIKPSAPRTKNNFPSIIYTVYD